MFPTILLRRLPGEIVIDAREAAPFFEAAVRGETTIELSEDRDREAEEGENQKLAEMRLMKLDKGNRVICKPAAI